MFSEKKVKIEVLKKSVFFYWYTVATNSCMGISKTFAMTCPLCIIVWKCKNRLYVNLQSFTFVVLCRVIAMVVRTIDSLPLEFYIFFGQFLGYFLCYLVVVVQSRMSKQIWLFQIYWSLSIHQAIFNN